MSGLYDRSAYPYNLQRWRAHTQRAGASGRGLGLYRHWHNRSCRLYQYRAHHLQRLQGQVSGRHTGYQDSSRGGADSCAATEDSAASGSGPQPGRGDRGCPRGISCGARPSWHQPGGSGGRRGYPCPSWVHHLRGGGDGQGQRRLSGDNLPLRP